MHRKKCLVCNRNILYVQTVLCASWFKLWCYLCVCKPRAYRCLNIKIKNRFQYVFCFFLRPNVKYAFCPPPASRRTITQWAMVVGSLSLTCLYPRLLNRANIIVFYNLSIIDCYKNILLQYSYFITFLQKRITL